MKYKLKKNKLITNVFWTIIFVLALTMSAISSNYLKLLSSEEINSTTVIKTDKNVVRNEYFK